MTDNADQMPCRLLLTPEALEGLAEKSLESRQRDDICRLLSAHSSRRHIENLPRGQGRPEERAPLCVASMKLKEMSVSECFPLRDSLMRFLLRKVFFSAPGKLNFIQNEK